MSTPKIIFDRTTCGFEFGNSRIFGASGSNKGNIHRPPLDLMMISGYLKKEGYDNTLIDANSSRRTIDDVKR